MKIIDLLVKISKGEEVPRKIKHDDNFYIYDERFEDYFCEEKDLYLICKIIGEDDWKMSFALNIGVEIIEEDKKIEKLEKFIPQRESDTYCTKYNEVVDKINEIIDEVNRCKY